MIAMGILAMRNLYMAHPFATAPTYSTAEGALIYIGLFVAFFAVAMLVLKAYSLVTE